MRLRRRKNQTAASAYTPVTIRPGRLLLTPAFFLFLDLGVRSVSVLFIDAIML